MMFTKGESLMTRFHHSSAAGSKGESTEGGTRGLRNSPASRSVLNRSGSSIPGLDRHHAQFLRLISLCAANRTRSLLAETAGFLWFPHREDDWDATVSP